jgi:hypothetical protein
MEKALFVPCTRMRDIMRAFNEDHEHEYDGESPFPNTQEMDFEEVKLRDGVNFMHSGFTLDDLWDLASRKIVWMGRETFVALIDDDIFDFRELFDYETLFSVRPATSLDADGEENDVEVCSCSLTDTTTTIFDCILKLMPSSKPIWTHLELFVLPSTEALSRFFSNPCSSGTTIQFQGNCLPQLSQAHLCDYLRVLEVSTGPHHRIKLTLKTNWSQLQIETVAKFLVQRCQCVIALHCFKIPVPPLIIDALRGDCNIVDLRLEQVPDIDGLVRALAKNKSLVRLHFVCTRIHDDNWTELCQSLSRHPKLEYLCLFHTFPRRPRKYFNKSKTRRMGKTRRSNVFLNMLQANTVLQELDAPRHHNHVLDPCEEFDECILSDVIQPYLRRLPHVRDFGKCRGPGYGQLLARALHNVNDSPALVWMLVHSSIPTIIGLGEGN